MPLKKILRKMKNLILTKKTWLHYLKPRMKRISPKMLPRAWKRPQRKKQTLMR